ncbi:MAG: hypothetical protein H0T68_07830, partial [Gemmatimonadales bacterium]|nr:hypothetical protein [Gemmatimonadales bacterium]
IGLSLAAVANVNRTGFHDLWQPSPGGEIAAGAPFYLGRVELGAERMSFDGRGDTPDYRAWFVFAGWGLDVRLLRSLGWEPGVRVGNYAMRFSGAGIPDHRRAESELGAEAVSRIVWGFAPEWHLLLTGRYRAVLTEPGIRHALVDVGVRRTIGTPRWLRDFLD